ncbi:putative enoyl-CoA hydratase 2, mitochondrial [Zea mays]|uniref:Putative enoyl-CoA hydratase 2, mitochondrial n=1 Tax=Zea mays TaxID=4577 RepID=A0A3L6EKG9_MAIZE|nr:putative enoyl-CoA hydratase 2, mitochondrial [Zea mays]
MLGLRRLPAVSGRLAPEVTSVSAASSHSAVFFRTLQILVQQGPVRLQKLSAPDTGPGIVFPSCDSLVTGIVELRLERPEAKNAIGKEMLQGLRSAIQEVEADTAANVVLVTSSVPKVFCAGADLKERRLMGPSEVRDFVNSLRSTFSSFELLSDFWKFRKSMVMKSETLDKAIQANVHFACILNCILTDKCCINSPIDVNFCIMFKQALSIPTIAVVEGVAFGGGLELALSCDLRICGSDFNLHQSYAYGNRFGKDAKFSLPETGLAIIPGAGGTQRLPRIVGRSRAKELIFTGRRFDAVEAVTMGVVNYCVPAGDAYQKALELAREINQKGPLAVKMAKKAIDQGAEVDLPSALVVEEECYQQVLHTEDRLEGLAAFAEKRKPIYKGK